MNILYPTIFTPDETGSYFVEFPDIPNCFTEGDTLKEAFSMGQEVLAAMCGIYLENKGTLPPPSDISSLQPNEGFVSLVGTVLPANGALDTTSVNKTVTLPKWLNDAATERGINFSAALRNALLRQL